ncbi:MAG: hypothetical protein JEZ14_04915 [Marinilabiliaceae bacterium]|nr:hypothetical protein [Marinilabiliaceae bacterium]
MKWLLFIFLYVILIWSINRMEESHFILVQTADTLTRQTLIKDSLPSIKPEGLPKDTISKDTLVKTKYPYGIPRGLFLRGIEL